MRRWILSLVVSVGLCVPGAGYAEEATSFKDVEKAFRKAWANDKKAPLKSLAGRREAKRKTLTALQATGNAKAVAALVKAGKRQIKFAAFLETGWADRREDWLRAEEAMRRALATRPVSPDGVRRVTRAEKAWVDEEEKLERLFRHISEERDVASAARTALVRILEGLQDKARANAIKTLVGEIGKGETPAERDFVRALGETAGEDVTQALLALARQPLSPLTQVALEALGIQNAPDNVDLLLSFMQDERWQVRAAAIAGLGHFHDARVVEALIEIAQKEPGVLQRHCFVSLSRILGEAVPGGVDAWSNWWRERRAGFVTKWTGKRRAPVRSEPAPVMLRQGQGHTSFYGIQTNSKHIVFIIDRSGSMNEAATVKEGAEKDDGKTRMDVAKEQLKKAIASLGSDETDERGAASFNVVAYAGDVVAYKRGRMVEATVKNKEAVFKWIDNLQADGPTNIFDAIEAAFEIISARKQTRNAAKGADTFFLMTDGVPTTGKVRAPDLIRQEVRKLNSTRQIIFHTIEITGTVSDQQKQMEEAMKKRMTPKQLEEYEQLQKDLAVFLEQLAAENRGEHIKR